MTARRAQTNHLAADATPLLKRMQVILALTSVSSSALGTHSSPARPGGIGQRKITIYET